jgi:hypothetical protein
MMLGAARGHEPARAGAGQSRAEEAKVVFGRPYMQGYFEFARQAP